MQKNDTERKNELAKQKAHDIKKYKGSPYKSFIQMNRRIDKFSSFSVAIKDNPIASRILLFMIYHLFLLLFLFLSNMLYMSFIHQMTRSIKLF